MSGKGVHVPRPPPNESGQSRKRDCPVSWNLQSGIAFFLEFFNPPFQLFNFFILCDEN